MNTHKSYVEALAMFGTGSTVIILDSLKFGTVIFGFMGSILAVVGGFEAWRAKRTERRLREMELSRLEKGFLHAHSRKD